MNWEIGRHNWSEIDARLVNIPKEIRAIIGAASESDAESIHKRIDSAVLRNGVLLAGSPEVASCLVQGLHSASTPGRREMLDLLGQLGAGAVAETSASEVLVLGVRKEILLGLPLYAEFLENGARPERFNCIDILSSCAEIDFSMQPRIRTLLLRAALLGSDEKQLVRAILDSWTSAPPQSS